MKDYYDILGLAAAATPEQIKSMYRKLAHKYHADVNATDPDLQSWSHKKMSDLNEAYEVLSDSVKRAAYDRERQGTGSTEGPAEPRGGKQTETDDGVFAASKSYYVSDAHSAQRCIEKGLEAVFDREGGKVPTKDFCKLASALGRRGANRWLPLGSYSGVELRARIDALLAYTQLRLEGRSVADRIAGVAWVAFAIGALIYNPLEASGWPGRILGGMLFAMLMAGFWVILPLKALRGLLRLCFDCELGAKPRSWIWQGLAAGCLTGLLLMGMADDFKKPGEIAQKKSSPTWETDFKNSKRQLAALHDSSGKMPYQLVLFFDAETTKGLVLFVDFDRQIKRASAFQISPLIFGSNWKAEGTVLVYQGDAEELLQRFQASDGRLLLSADPVDGTPLTAGFDISNLTAVAPILAATRQWKAEQAYRQAQQEKERLQGKLCQAIAEKFAKLVMERMGGGQDLDVQVSSWSHDSFRDRYSISLTMSFHGAIIWANIYQASVNIVTERDGTLVNYEKTGGNISL